MTRDVRQKLAANRTTREKLSRDLHDAELRERALIADAWYERIPPGEIATLTGRSTAHVRKLRPEDVPPARTGGNAARPAAADA